jgi:hypothetical protein
MTGALRERRGNLVPQTMSMIRLRLTMRKRRPAIVVMLTLFVLLAIAWLAFSPSSDLSRPVMEGQPIGFWLERMVSGAIFTPLMSCVDIVPPTRRK